MSPLPDTTMTDETGPSATLWRARDVDWRAVVKDVLGKRDLDSLISHSDDGLSIEPIYRCRDDICAPICRRNLARPWVIVQRVDDLDVARAKTALEADLSGGAGGIEFVFDGSAAAARSGFGLHKGHRDLLGMLSDRGLQVRIEGGAATYEHYRQFESLALDETTLSFDPLADAASRGGFTRPLAEIEDIVVRAARGLQDRALSGCAVVADGRVWAAGGASEAQEIAGMLGSMVHSLRVLIDGGLTPWEALDSIGLVVDVGANQLLAIAKLRALRLCHARIVEEFGSEPVRVRIHAETSWRMMARYDFHTNILRSTSAAFAAGIAGADSVTVLPCTIAVGLPDAFARRMARNTQAILIEESGLARVDDPGAGSGAIESLTEAVAEEAWEEFRKIERAGGLAAALRSGIFQAEIADTRRTRTEKIAHRQISITGVSRFPTLRQAETAGIATLQYVPEALPANAETIVPVRPERLAQPFEALRDRAVRLADSGRAPKVFLANFGSPGDFAEAAQFAVNLFAAGGIAVVDEGGFDTPEEASRAFSISGAKAACIIGGRDILDRHAMPIAQALKKSRASRVYVVGSGDAGNAIDAALNEETDVITVLTEVLALSE